MESLGGGRLAPHRRPMKTAIGPGQLGPPELNHVVQSWRAGAGPGALQAVIGWRGSFTVLARNAVAPKLETSVSFSFFFFIFGYLCWCLWLCGNKWTFIVGFIVACCPESDCHSSSRSARRVECESDQDNGPRIVSYRDIQKCYGDYAGLSDTYYVGIDNALTHE